MRKIVIFFGAFLVIGQAMIGSRAMAMELGSPEFKNNGYISKKFSYRGKNVNPALIIDNIPAGARSLALIINDPDAPSGDWVHWVVYEIPVISRIEENSVPGKQGITDFGRIGYDGPCPPFGTHRYIFKVYALDTELELEEGLTKVDLEEAIEGHILAMAELTGLFKK